MTVDESSNAGSLVCSQGNPVSFETAPPRQERRGSLSQQLEADPLVQDQALALDLPGFYRAIICSDFFKKVAETYLTQISLIVVGLATTVVVARVLGPEGRGFLAVATAISGLGVQFGNLGLNASNTYYVAKDHSLLPQLLGNTLVVSFALAGSGALVFCLLFQSRPYLAPIRGSLLVLSLAWIPFGLAYMLLQNLLLGVQDVRGYNKIELLSKLLALAFIGFLIIFGFVSSASVFLMFFLALLLSFAWAFRRLYILLHRPLTTSAELFRGTIRLGIKAYLICLFSFIVLKADILLIKHFVGAEGAGYYSVATSVSGYLATLPIAVAAILFPKLSAMKDAGERLRFAKRASIGTSLLLGLLLLFATVSAKVIVRFLFGKAFLPAASAFIWLAPGAFFLGVESVMVQFLNSLGYPRSVVVVWFLVVLLNVGLNVLAIPHYGIIGAAAVSSFSYILTFLAILWLILEYKSRGVPVSPITSEQRIK